MIQPEYNKQNNTTFLGFDSIEIKLVLQIKLEKVLTKMLWENHIWNEKWELTFQPMGFQGTLKCGFV